MYDVEFTGTLAETDVAAMTGSAASLTSAPGIVTGVLDLDQAAIDTLLGDDASVDSTLEIQVEPDASSVATLVQTTITICQDLL